MLAYQLKEQVTKARQSPGGMHTDIYMSTYILDVIYARQLFPSLEWAWPLMETIVNIYFKLLSKCNFRGVITWLSDHFVTPMYTMIFKQDPLCMSKESMEALIGIVDWYTSSSSTFIPMFNAEKPPHVLPNFYLIHTNHSTTKLTSSLGHEKL